jgi:low affinity Fe/Cu permease
MFDNDNMPKLDIDKNHVGAGFTATFSSLSNWVARASGMPATFILALLVILLWGVTGPVFNYSNAWQLVINTGTTIVTFLMVFLIQNTQYRDSLAIQVKLDELLRAVETANSRFVGIEKLNEDEVEKLQEECVEQAKEEIEDAMTTGKERPATRS